MSTRRLAFALLLASGLIASGCRNERPSDVPPHAEETMKKPTMGKYRPDQVKRVIPDTCDTSAWNQAFDAYVGVARASPSILSRPGILCELSPLQDPAGEVVPFLMVSRGKNSRVMQLALDGTYIPPREGQQAAERYFAAINYPDSRTISRHLLGELLLYFGVLKSPFYPIAHTWEQVDAHYEEQDLPKPKLIGDASGVTFIVEARVQPADDTNHEDGGDTPANHIEKRVEIAPGGKITVETRELP